MASNTPSVLDMPTPHEEWLCLESWRVLHRISAITPADIDDGLPNGQGRALCGASGHFIVPGFMSRMGLPRCAHCCRLLGIPRGIGNTLNGRIDEGDKVPRARWEHYDELEAVWAR